MRKLQFLLLLLFLWTATPRVVASDEFKTTHDTTYAFDATGKSTVIQNISLTNRISGAYATQYQLQIQGETPQNVSALNSLGPLKTTVSPLEPDGALVTVYFSQPIV